MTIYIAHASGFDFQNALMIGDAKNDVLMAQDAGVTPVVVLTGHLSKNEAQALGVEYIIQDVTKLPSVLQILESLS